MAHRRVTEPQPPQAPIQALWVMPDVGQTEPGRCPKCGEYFGNRRVTRAHARNCNANISNLPAAAASDC